MKTLQETITENFADPLYHATISEYANTIDELEDLELHDIAQNTADGHEDVIYCSKAHALIARVSSDVSDQAEEEAQDCGGFDGKSYDDIACLIAYHIIRQETYETLKQEVAELACVLEQFAEETQDEEQEELAEDLITTLESK